LETGSPAAAADPHQRHLRQQRRRQGPGPGAGPGQGPGVHAELLRLAKRLQADPTTRFPPTVWIRLAATQPLYFPPGSGYHYSNVGFEVLGLVIEQATGQPLQQVYRERIIWPLA
jgi:CubicO group peptidase (beta-lactamase class C family)